MLTPEAVQVGADIFTEAERRAKATRKDLRDLRDVFEALRDNGDIGLLECQALASEADTLGTRHEAEVYALHARLTARAKELGIDLPTVPPGGMGTMGGGDR